MGHMTTKPISDPNVLAEIEWHAFNTVRVIQVHDAFLKDILLANHGFVLIGTAGTGSSDGSNPNRPPVVTTWMLVSPETLK